MQTTETNKTKSHRVPAGAIFAVVYGNDIDAMLHDSIDRGDVAACCDQECRVEPDGYCVHGCPSILIAIGLI